MSNKEEIINKLSKIEEERKMLEESLKKIKDIESETKRKIEEEQYVLDAYKFCYYIISSNKYSVDMFKRYFEKAMSIKNMINENIPISENKSIMFLHEVIRHGFYGLIGYLIEKGADVNAVNSDGYTPLMIFGLFGETDSVRYLLGCDKLFDWKTDDKGNYHEVCVAENKNKVNTEIRKDGKPALYFASQRCDVKLIRILHKIGARMVDMFDEDNDSFVIVFVKNMYILKKSYSEFTNLIEKLRYDNFRYEHYIYLKINANEKYSALDLVVMNKDYGLFEYIKKTVIDIDIKYPKSVDFRIIERAEKKLFEETINSCGN